MQKIISIILSILFLFLSVFVPIAADPAKSMTVGEWLTEVDKEFGMTANKSDKPYYSSITSADPYFKQVQIAYEWGVIDDKDSFKTSDAVSAEFVVKTLVEVARLESDDVIEIKDADSLKYAEQIGVAVAKGIIFLKADKSFEKFQTTYDNCVKLLTKVKEIWANQKFGLGTSSVEYAEEVVEINDTDYSVNGNKLVLSEDADVEKGDIFSVPGNDENLNGGIYKAEKVTVNGDKTVVETTEVAPEDVIDTVKFQGGITPDFRTAEIKDAQGNVIQQSIANNEGLKDKLLDKISSGSISLGSLGKAKYSFNDGGFDISVTGNIGNGITLSKSYSVSNFDVQAKFDGSLKGDIKEAYVVLNYDAVDTTAVNGSYAASLGSNLKEDVSSQSAIDQIKANIKNLNLQSGSATFPLFTVTVAIPNCPAITINLKASLRLFVNGQAELIITTSNCKGYEIINNQGRLINETTEVSKTFKATGTAEVTVGLNASICAFSQSLIDLGVEGGVGVYAYATVSFPTSAGTTTNKIDFPADAIAQATALLDNADEITVKGQADFYGIMRISVGQDSLIKKIGLSKTWTIFDRSNGTFASLTF